MGCCTSRLRSKKSQRCDSEHHNTTLESSSEETKDLVLFVHKNSHKTATHLLEMQKDVIENLTLYFLNWDWKKNEAKEKEKYFFKCIENCTNLKYLSIDGSGLSSFPSFTLNYHIETLALFQLNSSLSDEICEVLLKNDFNNLKHLYLGHIQCLTDRMLHAIFTACKNLVGLWIESCMSMTPNGFQHMCCLKHLTTFVLNTSSMKGNLIIPHIIKCKSLVSVKMLRVSGISSQKTDVCIKNLPLLEELEFSSFPNYRYVHKSEHNILFYNEKKN